MRIPEAMSLVLAPDEDLQKGDRGLVPFIQRHRLPVLVSQVRGFGFPELKYDHGDYLDGSSEILKNFHKWFQIPVAEGTSL